MAARADELRKQVNDLWRQAVDQLDEVKEALSDRIEQDRLRLRSERDKLLKRLGEQTHKLTNQGKLPVPAVVKRTVERLNKVIDNLVKRQKRPKKKPAKKKKKAAKRTTKRKTKKKTTTRKKR